MREELRVWSWIGNTESNYMSKSFIGVGYWSGYERVRD